MSADVLRAAALDLVAGPAVAQEAVLVQAVALVRDLDLVAAVAAAAAQDRDQGPEVGRDRAQAQALAMVQDLEVARGPALAMVQVLAADTDLALVLDLEQVAFPAMAFAFTSGATLTRRGRICTTLAP